jgi:two-component system, OmpR family, response regulator
MILIVDDDQELLELLRQTLTQEGFEVRCAESVRDAERVLDASPAQLLILDLSLPGESGIMLCKRLRSAAASLPILVLTAHSAVKTRVESLDAGADDYLSKPFAVAELRARVRALLRRANASLPNYSAGSVQLDFGSKRAEVAGKQAPITAKEWAILEVLWAARGAVVSRAQLLEQAWPQADESKQASLDVLMSRIRRKLGSDVVRTLRGGGYALRQGSQ